MNGNPIIIRESRSRWRGARAFLLVFIYALLLAAVTSWHYFNFSSSVWYSSSLTYRPRPSALGSQLFLSLSLLQTIGWMLLAPALTATSIAGERERGLLEAVQLSHMTPGRIVWGKLASALTFIALMMPVSLPITATCFLLGGVAPQSLAAMTLLQLVTGAAGASIGLFFSARSRRAQAALAGAFVFTAVWGLGSHYAFEEWSSGAMSLGPTTQWPGNFWLLAMRALAATDPIHACRFIIDPYAAGATVWGVPLLGNIPMWIINIALQLLACAVLMWMAARSLRKPLPDLMLSDRRWTDPVRESFARLMAASAARAANARERAASRLAQKAGNALLWELPLDKLIRFGNPVLQREVRGKFRWRRGSVWTSIFQGILALVAGGIYAAFLFSAFDAPSRSGAWWALAPAALIVLMLATAVMSASAFTREREGGTWEGLRLSLLAPHAIIGAKLLAPLIACFYYALPLLPILPFYVRFSYGSGNWNYGVSIEQAIATLLILVCAALLCLSIGLFFSALCARTVASVSWTLATIFLLFGLWPIVLGYAGVGGLNYHPFSVLTETQHRESGFEVLSTAFRYAEITLIFVGLNLAATNFVLRFSTHASKPVST